jgi:transcriptional regulator with XRE-family HTH domain
MRFQSQILKDARAEAGLTMEQLADRAGVAIGTVHTLETGSFKRGPGAEVVSKLATALNREWVSFFGPDLRETEHAQAAS